MLRETKVLLGRKAQLETKALQVHLVPLDPLAFRVLRDLQGSQEILVKLDKLVIVDQLVVLVPLEMLDSPEIQATQDLLEHPDHRG